MNTEQLIEYFKSHDEDAENLLNALNPNLKTRFLRACSSLAKVVDEIRVVYPDAMIFIESDVPTLILGNPHCKETGMANEIVNVTTSTSLIGRIDSEDVVKEQITSNWISVKDRLPGQDQFVLCYEPKGSIYTNEYGSCYNKCRFLYDSFWLEEVADNFVINPTHWQELPKPPKEDK